MNDSDVAIDEGYIKYVSHYTNVSAPNIKAAKHLEEWRQRLFFAGLVGHYEALNIGYGNISIRCGEPGQFLITGTQTGHIAKTTEEHYSLVTAYDIAANTVSCRGPVQASSESMTHAAIYELDTEIAAIVHVHSKSLWQRYLNDLPTTREDIAYGTPQMADEFRRLFEETAFRELGIAVMAGHEEGLISIGETLEQAAARVLELEAK